MRVLYSFPHPLGGNGIGTVAWHHVVALARAGAEVTVVTTKVHRPLDPSLGIRAISVLGPVRPRMIGRARADGLVDRVTAHQLRLRRPDVVHVWPGAVLRTAARAARLGIPAVREAPSPYTRTAVAQAARAWADVGLDVPAGHFHYIPESSLAAEDTEFGAVDRLLVGSPEAVETFDGLPFADKVVLNRYGFDPEVFHPAPVHSGPPTVVFIGRCEPTKGIHVLLRSWAEVDRPPGARLLLCGTIPAEVRELFSHELRDSSVVECGRVPDMGDFLAEADVMVLPSFSEGSALVTYESIGAGVVPLVSTASGPPVVHDVDGLVHETGRQDQLGAHLERVLNDGEERARLRANGLAARDELTWAAVGRRLWSIYEDLAVEPAERLAARHDT